MRRRRGQAAMEFLTTYGWAIMVVLVMIGALAYFGVLTPTKYLPERCLFTTGITCKDYIALMETGDDLRVRFVLENGLGNPIIIPDGQVAVVYEGQSRICANESGNLNLGSGSAATFSCTLFADSGLASGQRVKLAVALNYTEVGGSFIHPITGDIQTTIP